MVYIVLTTKGLNDLVHSLAKRGELWLNGDVASNDRVSQLRTAGWSLTTWTQRFEPTNQQQLADALATVSEHHPDETIWVEQI